MTASITRNPAVAEYRRLRDQLLADGRSLPALVFHLAQADRHGEAVLRLREIAASARRVTRGPGRFAAEVAEPTAETMAATRNAALAHIERELHEAGPDQLGHLCRMAEACCSTDLGKAMRALVDHERADRIVIGRHRLGWDDEADRINRWTAQGQVGHWSDPEFDVPDPRLIRDGGEVGS